MHTSVMTECALNFGASPMNVLRARVAELVDALDLGSSVARRESSSLSSRTILTCMDIPAPQVAFTKKIDL